MNHRRGHSPKHYKGVLSYKEVPVDTLSQSIQSQATKLLEALKLSKLKPTKNTVRFKAINIVTKSLRIIATKTNRNSIRIKIRNYITKSLKIANNKIQKISAINCNKISSRTQTFILVSRFSNSVFKSLKTTNRNVNRKCLKICNRRLIKTSLCNKSHREDRKFCPLIFKVF